MTSFKISQKAIKRGTKEIIKDLKQRIKYYVGRNYKFCTKDYFATSFNKVAYMAAAEYFERKGYQVSIEDYDYYGTIRIDWSRM